MAQTRADEKPAASGAKKPLMWSDMTREELAAAVEEKALVLIPTGSIEQHAAHLPVETDALLAGLLARAAAQRMTGPVVVAPTVSHGFTPHHLSFPGTLSLRLETYLALITDLVKSVLDAGFARAMLINGHGGNAAPLRALCGQLITDGYAIGMVDYFAPGMAQAKGLLKGQLKGVGHACEVETALMMACLQGTKRGAHLAAAARDLAPRLIQPWIAPGHPTDPLTDAGAAWAAIFQADDCGYYGDPGAASLETGEALLEVLAHHLALFLERFSQTPLRVGVARKSDLPKFAG